jgi:aminoglycoside phosphotransferase (APT) family kinase protein
MAINSRIRTMASEFRGYSHQLQFLFGAGAITTEILASIGEDGWRIKRLISVDAARAVVAVGPPQAHAPAAVVKVSRDRAAARIMERERSVLSELRSHPRLAELRRLLPDEMAWGRIGDQAFVVESALPGVDARTLLDDPKRRARLTGAALGVAALLHRQTGSIVTVDQALTARWIEEPVREIQKLGAAYPRIAQHSGALEDFSRRLGEALLGRRMLAGWLHGDLFPGNILISPDGTTVHGLVDWDLAAADDLPALDAMHFLIGAHLIRTHSELGNVVLGLLDGDGFAPDEMATAEAELRRMGGDALTFREAVLLTWLRHVGWNLRKTAHFRRHRLWVKANVETVIGSLARPVLAR